MNSGEQTSRSRRLRSGFRLGIGPRIALFAVLLVTITASVVGAVVYSGVNRLLVQEEIENLGDIADLVAVRLQTRFDVLRRDTQLMGNMPPVAALARAERGGGEDTTTVTDEVAELRIASIFVETLRSKPTYFKIQLIHRDGRELVDVQRRMGEIAVMPDTALRKNEGGSAFRQGLELLPGAVHLSQVAFAREDGRAERPHQPVIRSFTPVHVDNELFGVVVVSLDFDAAMGAILEREPQLADIHLFVTNSEGDYLYHPDPLQRFGFEFGRQYRIQDGYPDLAPLFLPGDTTVSTVVRETEEDGSVLHFLKVEVTPEQPEYFIGLALAASYHELLAPSIEVGRFSAVVSVILVAAAAVAAVVFARRLTRPIQELTHAAESVAAGDFDVSLPVSAGHEVGLLAHSFRTMVDQVEDRGLAVQQKAAELERVNRELEQFVYVVSHDLKAPLRAVSNLSTWLEEDLADRIGGEDREHLALLRSRVERMDEFIEALLALSRAGRVCAEPEPVDTHQMVADIVAMLEVPPRFSIQIAADMPQLETDRVHLAQVFGNLLGNAVKHHDRPDGTVRVGWVEKGDWYQFEVADDGPGIAPEYQDRIFQVFQTLKARDEGGSTGIGLAIVKKVVESVGGRIWVESSPGQGAIFRFTWPKRLPVNP